MGLNIKKPFDYLTTHITEKSKEEEEEDLKVMELGTSDLIDTQQ